MLSERSTSGSTTGQLALIFQEPLTTVTRLRANRGSVPSLDGFRTHIMTVLRGAEAEALQCGYPKEYVHYALYAVVAFLDETAMDSKNTALAGWVTRPIQPEWFKGLIAGKTFFQHLEQLLQAGETALVADVLEIYQLCLLLGYSGQFAKDPSALRNLEARVHAKILRIRRDPPRLSEPALPKPERLALAGDITTRWLAVVTAVIVVSAVLTFALAYRSIAAKIDVLSSSAMIRD
jgi:type VI secretion system protein ImpK